MAGWAALLCSAALLWRVARASVPGRRPNVVWVMADDLGWGEVGLFPANSSHGRIATPHLDKFGQEGMVFRNAYAGYTVCAPSRTTFFTGRHSGKFVEHGLSGTRIEAGQNVTTLAQVLHRAGYATGAFGKVAPLMAPLRQGFDSFIGQIDQGLCHNMYPRHIDFGDVQLSYKLAGNWRRKSRELCMASPEDYNYTIDAFHASGMAWLETVAKGPKPFFLYLSYTVPHAGGWGDAPAAPEEGAPVPSDMGYANQPWPDVERDHAAVIAYLDAKVGDLMERLGALGIDENTLVFFASDNGAHLEGGHDPAFFDSTGGLRGHKRSFYEGGVRSPSMARWPGVVPAGAVSDFAWAFWDVLPTIAELAGALQLPQGLDGLSIAATLRGAQQAPHEYLYWTWVEHGGLPGYAVRAGAWKGVVRRCADRSLRPSAGDAMELYDLEADPSESRDVAADRPGIAARLRALVVSKGLSCQCFQAPGCPWVFPGRSTPAQALVV